MRRAALVGLAVAALLAGCRGREGEAARVVEHHGRWESGYGVEFYNVVGRLQNTSEHALRYVKLKVEALDAAGTVVAATETYNESAEVLTVPEAKPNELLASGKIKPLGVGAEERFRASFLKEETPPFANHRVTVVEAPAAAP